MDYINEQSPKNKLSTMFKDKDKGEQVISLNNMNSLLQKVNKAKDDQIVKEILCLGNISDDWTAANAQKTGLWGEIYNFAVDYTSTNIGDIYNIHRYLMKKHNINS